MTRYTNEHLSYSRLSRFEQCPLSFKLHYIDKRQAERERAHERLRAVLLRNKLRNRSSTLGSLQYSRHLSVEASQA